MKNKNPENKTLSCLFSNLCPGLRFRLLWNAFAFLSLVIGLVSLAGCGTELTEDMINYLNKKDDIVIVSGDHQLTLSWPLHPLAEKYWLYYTTNGTEPAPDNGIKLEENIQPPFQLTELTNGQLYTFQLVTQLKNGKIKKSAFFKAMPLSSLTLAPCLMGTEESIQLSWPNLPANKDQALVRFQVWRGTSRSGPFKNISGLLTAPAFTDSDVSAGIPYFYKIRPVWSESRDDGLDSEINTTTRSVVPRQVEEFGSYSIPEKMIAMAAFDSYILAAFSTRGLQVIDVSDPASPRLAADYSQILPEFQNANKIFSIGVQGHYAFLFEQDKGLSVLDIADPVHPALQGVCSKITYINQGTINSDYAWLASKQNGLVLYDISSPSNPVYIKAYEQIDGQSLLGAQAVAIKDHYALVGVFVVGTQCSRLLQLDISNPLQPVYIGSYNAFFSVGKIGFKDIYACATDPIKGVYLFNLATESAPERTYLYSENGWVNDFFIAGRYAYLAYGYSALKILDISQPKTTTLALSWEPAKGAYFLAACGPYVVAALDDTVRQLKVLRFRD